MVTKSLNAFFAFAETASIEKSSWNIVNFRLCDEIKTCNSPIRVFVVNFILADLPTSC